MSEYADEIRRRTVTLHSDALPRAVDAEAALMDAALYGGDARTLLLELPTGAVTSPAYQPILATMRQMLAAGATGDRIAVLEAAAAQGLDRQALWDTMQDIDGASSSDAMAGAHARIIRERYEERLVIQRVHAALELMVTKPGESRQTARRLVESMLDFAGESVPGFVPAHVAVAEAFDDAQARARGDTSVTITTGIAQLDDDPVGGLEPGDLVTWPMVSGHGKTAAMALLALRAAISGTGVAVFECEMVRRQLGRRWVSLLTGLPYTRLKNWALSSGEIARAVYAHGMIADLPLYVDDQGTPTLSHVLTQARRKVLRDPRVKIVCVDYGTLIEGPGKSVVEQNINTIRALKRMAKELGVAVVVLLQVDAKAVANRPVMEQMPEVTDVAWGQEFRNQSDVMVTGFRPGEAKRQASGASADIEDTEGWFEVRKGRNCGSGDRWRWGWDGKVMAYDGGCWHWFNQQFEQYAKPRMEVVR